MALADRQLPRGLIHHSDRGIQYASLEYQQLLARHGIIGSMSRNGNCWDNAVAESLFRHSQDRAGVSKPSGAPGPRPAAKSLNTSNCSTTADGAIPCSITCVQTSSNYVVMNQWPLNPSVHVIGAGSVRVAYAEGYAAFFIPAPDPQPSGVQLDIASPSAQGGAVAGRFNAKDGQAVILVCGRIGTSLHVARLQPARITALARAINTYEMV
jgi:hypothetical protein